MIRVGFIGTGTISRRHFGALARLTLIACGGVLVLVPFAVGEALFWLPSTLSWQSVGLVLAAALWAIVAGVAWANRRATLNVGRTMGARGRE